MAEPGPTPIRVLIVDDHDMFGSSLAHVLDEEADLKVVDVVTTGKAALERVEATHPDVVLLDHRLPDTNGVDLVAPMIAGRTPPSIVMLTASTSDQVLLAAIEAGAAGFLDKSRSVNEVMAAVRSAASGESLISPQLLARLLPRLRRQRSDPATSLTERENDVLTLLARGLSNADIADELTVSVNTVRNHIANLSAKLGAHSKLEVLAVAVRRGLVAG